MKIHLLFALGLIACLLVCCGGNKSPKQPAEEARHKLAARAQALKQYATGHNASTQWGILIDMSISSWKNRFFVVNLKNDSVLISGLVAHGGCGNYAREEVIFGNTPGCGCSSEGHYRIGNKYYGTFGLAYKLHGLDTTNNKAYERFVVFHSHECVNDYEGVPTCRSDGCPTVSPTVLKQTAALLDKSEKPVMMWIYK